MNICNIDDKNLSEKLNVVLEYINENAESFDENKINEIGGVLDSVDVGVLDKFGSLYTEAQAYINGKNSRVNLRSSGLPASTGRFVSESYKRFAKSQMQLLGSMSSIYRRLFRRGELDAGIFLADSGLDAFARGTARAEEAIKKFEDGIESLLGNVSSLRTLTGQHKMGIIAHLIKVNPENENNFMERLQQIMDAPAKYIASGTSHDTSIAAAINSIIEEFGLEGITSREEFLEKVYNNKKYSNERKIVDYVIGSFAEILPEHSKVASMFFNVQLDPQVNYTPDTIRKSHGFKPGRAEKKSMSDFLDNHLSEPGARISTQPKSQSTKKVQRVVEMAEDEVHSFSFIDNVRNKFKDAVYDIQLTEPLSIVNNYLNNDEVMSTVFTNKQESDFAKKVAENFIRNVRGGVRDEADALNSLRKTTSRVAEIATIRALGSLSQPIKQFFPAMIKTIIMAAGNPSVIPSLIRPYNSPAENAFIKAFSTSEYRGLTSQIGSLERDLAGERSVTGQYLRLPFRKLASLSRGYLDNLLVKPDKFVANKAWLSYYKQYVKSTTGQNVDFENESPNQRAIAFANAQVDLTLNASLSQSMGAIFSSQNVGLQLVRRILIPFGSMQQANRNNNIAAVHAILSSGAKVDDEGYKRIGGKYKNAAVKSLVANAAEMALFNSIRFAIGYSIQTYVEDFIADIIDLAYPDEDDEIYDKFMKSTFTSVVSDVVPIPGIDYIIINLTNMMLDEDSPLLEYLYRQDIFKDRQSSLFFDAEVGAGTYDVIGDDVVNLLEMFSTLLSGEKKGMTPAGEPELSAREYAQIEILLALTALSYFTPSDLNTSYERMWKRIKFDREADYGEISKESLESDGLREQKLSN